MYLKSIEMQGFKSFADKIYLDFNPGVTAIVGPNGSGKSNISDAIRWVMGEQSIKTLRGGKMEDVIFSGTEQRKPLGFAEVSLVIDNSTKIFPLDYSEISVTRRIYRTGDSEYMINKAPCRLKDIHELFMDTGLGREGYSIIGQGKIDEILSNKSEDRRHIFEEAAGITKFKYRKNEAEKKLHETTENLTRVSDIMLGISEQLEPLREQSQKAKKYLTLREELKDLDVAISVIEINNNKKDLSSIDENIKTLTFDLNVVQNNIDLYENKINAMYDTIKKSEDEIETLREDEKSNIAEINERSNNINIITSNIEHENENISRIKLDIEKSKNSGKYLDSLLLEYQKRISEFETEKALLEEALKEKEDNALKIEEKEQNKFNLIDSIKSDISENKEKIIALDEKTSAANALIETFTLRKENLSKDLEAIRTEIADKRQALSKFELSALEKDVNKARTEHNEILAQYESALEELKKFTQEKIFLETEINKNISRTTVLEELEKEYDGYGKSIKHLMTAYKNKKLGNIVLHGPLSSLLNTDSKYITAIEVALQNANQNIVTDTEDDAKIAIKFLKDTNGGRITFLPISIIKPRKSVDDSLSLCSGYIGVASELVTYDSKYENVISSVLGGTVVADNIDNAVKIAKKADFKLAVVTLSGELIRPGGSITGGSINKTTGFLSRNEEIKRLNDELLGLKDNLDSVAKEYGRLSLLSGELFEKNSVFVKVVSEKSEIYANVKAACEAEKGKLISLKESDSKLSRELSEIISAIDNTKEDIKEFSSVKENLQNQISENEVSLQKLIKETDGNTNELEEIKKEIIDLNLKLNNVFKDISYQNERYDDILVQIENSDNINEERSKEIQAHEQTIKEMKSRIEILENEKLSLIDLSDKNSKKIEQLSFDKNNLSDNIRKLQIESNETREQLFSLKNQVSKLENKKYKIESGLDFYIDRLWEEYELSYSEAEKLAGEFKFDEFNISSAKKKIDQLKSDIKQLGNINIDAIEGYKSIKEKYDFLTKQTDDLNKSKEEMEKLIEDLSNTMKKQFSSQFDSINKNFQAVFKELFGGGTAKLELSEPDNLLETGIEIEAQPPGKKLQRLSLLSGGERAFTAIALLFAILKVRPTPFCILDEIEAALDDVNVYRYADYLKKFSKNTQFIVVTHRRGTMESANVLYGVTMQERGVSKLLTLNIDEVTE